MSDKWQQSTSWQYMLEQPMLCRGKGAACAGLIQWVSADGWVGTVMSELSLLSDHLSRITSSFCTVAREGILTLCTVLSSLTQTLMYQPHRPYTTIHNWGNFFVKSLWETEKMILLFPLFIPFPVWFSFLWINARFIALGEFLKACTVGLILLLLKPLGVLPMLLLRTELGQCCQLWSPRFVCTHVKVGNRAQIKWEPV